MDMKFEAKVNKPQNSGTDPFKLFICQIFQPDLPEVRLIPRFEQALVGPLADGGAQTSNFRSPGRFPRQKVRKVEKVFRFRPNWRQIFLEPEQFRGLHFDRDFAANIFKN